MTETNPNKVNQYTDLDPRQKVCWEYYVNPKSETFNNGLQSAIKAGYSESHANTITTEQWFRDRVRRLNMLSKAENVLEEMLDMPMRIIEWEGRGEDTEQVVNTEPALVKIKQDTAKFIAERVGKDIYSNRTELTGKEGRELIPDEKTREKSKEAIDSFLNDTKDTQQQ